MPRELIPCPSVASYTRGCRCAGCRAAKAEYTRLWRHRTGLTDPERASQLTHGSLSRYRAGCRCRPCKDANAAWQRAARARRRERLRAAV